MRWFRLTIAYDGTAYTGWQLQPGSATVQGVLEEALRRITGSAVRITASGRTDSGVHALGQVASFACDTHLAPEAMCRALNANTPEDIQVREVREAAEGFHAIRDAVAKRYRYVIQDGSHRDVLARRYCWHIPQRLDAGSMRAGAAHLVGTHDFRSFQAAGAPRKTTVRTVSDVRVARIRGPASDPIAVEVEADGFLYNMVRNIVGTLVLVGRGRKPATWVAEVLAGRDRALAGPTAPARGLTLLEVRYE
ncbi:MAG: tRNA pseudouridine(38-40) synthase TruA [Planctomycetes bacterium]|nr:tRNA pseudouridine(38-40) synthase TruA [Planctomycetota bacterium]